MFMMIMLATHECRMEYRRNLVYVLQRYRASAAVAWTLAATVDADSALDEV